MKNLFRILTMALCLLIAVPAATAQKTDRQLKKELRKNADRDSRKEAKALKKEGWLTMPGKISIAKQIMESKYAALDEDEKGAPLYFIGSNEAVGGNYSAAKQIADSRARLEIARAINNYIVEMVKESAATRDFGERDIETISEFVSANTSLVEAQLQGVVPTLEIYREGPNNTVDVRVMVKVNAADALKKAKYLYKSELEKKSEKLARDLDAILPY